MPNFDKTGPQGQGPMTGKGRGNCANSADSQAAESGNNTGKAPQGRGMGRGCGTGRGRGRGMGKGQGRGCGCRGGAC